MTLVVVPLNLFSSKLSKLRTLLVVLMLVALLPLITGITLLFSHMLREQDRHVRTTAIIQARTIMAVIDREFMRTHAVLKTLANQGLGDDQNLADFHSRAGMSARDLGASTVVLLKSNGKMVLSTKRPYGTTLPLFSNAPLLERTFTTGLPGVSSLFVSPIDRQFIYALSVPIRIDGEVVYSLSAIYTPDALNEILRSQRLPAGWRAAIIDDQGHIVTRTHEAAHFTGRTVLPKLKDQLHSNSEGAFDDITLDGILVMTAFSKSPLCHWNVVIGIPLEESAKPTRAYILQVVIVFGATLLVGAAIIWWLIDYLTKLIAVKSRDTET